MVVTRHRAGAPSLRRLRVSGRRGREQKLLVGALVVTALGLLQVYRSVGAELDGVAAGLDAGAILVLDQATTAEALQPYLTPFPDPEERSFVAERIVQHLQVTAPHNVGELSRIRVPIAELAGLRLPTLQARTRHATTSGAETVALLDSAQLRRLKSALVVRRPGEFRGLLFRWSLGVLVSLAAVHMAWRWRRFGGDQLLLPVVALLSGLGLSLPLLLGELAYSSPNQSGAAVEPR